MIEMLIGVDLVVRTGEKWAWGVGFTCGTSNDQLIVLNVEEFEQWFQWGDEYNRRALPEPQWGQGN
jgi:hypothetical protein